MINWIVCYMCAMQLIQTYTLLPTISYYNSSILKVQNMLVGKVNTLNTDFLNASETASSTLWLAQWIFNNQGPASRSSRTRSPSLQPVFTLAPSDLLLRKQASSCSRQGEYFLFRQILSQLLF